MKVYLRQAYQHRYFFLFIFLFAFVQSVYSRISVRRLINVYTFTPESALATLVGVGVLFWIILFFIRKWQKADAFHTAAILQIFGASLVSYVVSMQFIGLLIALAFGNLERNFTPPTLILSVFTHFLNGVIYGSFFLAYYYFLLNKKQQERLTAYNLALSESRINQLKSQLNPHFVFNNLNVLDQFIDEDRQKASDFLNEFAEIYRYVLMATDRELIDIQEELGFARQYFNLIRHKYGDAYQLHIKSNDTKGLIVPLTLQVLIENAIQHNLGTADSPVLIEINVNGAISVSNNVHLKRTTKTTSGRALKNLSEQYQLLTNETMTIHRRDGLFEVTVPIIPTAK